MKRMDDFDKCVFIGTGQAAEWIYEQLPDKLKKNFLGGVDLLEDTERIIARFQNIDVVHIKNRMDLLLNDDTCVVVAIGHLTVTSLVKKILSDYKINKENLFVPNPYVSLRGFCRCPEFMKDERIPFENVLYKKVNNMFLDELSIAHLYELTSAKAWDSPSDIYDMVWYPDIEKMYYWNEDYWQSYDFKEKSGCATILDCGAYIGDSIKNICRAIPESKIRYYAFEPCEDNINNMPSAKELSDYIEYFQVFSCGIGNENCKKNFRQPDDAEGGQFLSVEDESTDVLEIKRLDDMDLDIEGTLYIKMDIEGSELDALKGAENLIKKYRPCMAICLYHRKNDLVEIPLYINSLVSDYNYFLRGGYHTILWAMPKGA